MKYSFVVPIYNDGALAADFARETERAFRAYLGKGEIHDDVEVIFVDDGSKNDAARRDLASRTPSGLPTRLAT